MCETATKQMDANEMPLNATFFCTLGLAINMPGAGGQISHLLTTKYKTSGFMLFMALPQMYV